MNYLKRLKDPRYYQIFFLSGFLIYGLCFLHWETKLTYIATTFITCLSFQYIFNKVFTVPNKSLLSAFISALGLCLLLKSNHPFWYFLASFFAISSKFILKHHGKHFFNPVNLAIILSVVISNDSWISPGQWGNAGLLLFLFGSAGLIVLVKVKRVSTAISFLLTLFILQYLRTVVYLGWPLDHLFHSFFNGTLMLFSFFMITDPRTMPNHPKVRIIWAATIAIISFYLMNWHYLSSAPLRVLFFSSFLTPIINTQFIYQPFKWNSYEKVNA